ncbi:MAG: M20/M25/M40 family metallo-hydrolase [Bacteroidales bacterium]|nr:M20/M25/M40 family metallo-hydrolase [Bacteroidales bacterium]
MKHFYIITLFIFSSFLGFSQTYNADVEAFINEVNLDSLIFQLRNLSGEDPVEIDGEITTIEHRVSNWGNNLAANYLTQELEELGYEAQNHNYSLNGQNIYAIHEGSVYPDEYYMICTHYDAVDYYCADDNASGCAAVLEAARILKDTEFEYSIIFAFWDEEEIGLIGSGAYASEAASNGDIIHSVINMDMISWDNDGDMVAELHSSYQANSNLLADYIVEVNSIYGLQIDTHIELPGTSASDHSRFWSNGFPAVLVIEEYYGGDFNPYYHTEQDRIAILNMPYFHEMAKLSIGSLVSLSLPLLNTSTEELLSLEGINVNTYPNPFKHEATITYSLEEESFIQISLLNSFGKEISILENGIKPSGEHQLQLQAGNLSHGLYLLHTQTSKGTSIQKVMIN